MIHASLQKKIVVAVTGIRDVHPDSADTVECAIHDWAALADTMVFGGALGIDTWALEASDGSDVHRVVVLPGTLAQAPRAARDAVLKRPDVELVELRLPCHQKSSYLRRNDEMLRRADVLLAFTDGRNTGGTFYTMERAARQIPVEVIPVRSVGMEE